jgi:DNA repair exonuclease SbcCD ATPase subunit
MLQEAKELPAVTVYEDDHGCWLADGLHRLEARRRLGYSDILADVRPGTERDAMLYAFSANVRHGLASNRADRKQVAKIMLEDEEWKEFPNRKIGEICGLSHTTIGALRNSLESLSKIPSASRGVSSQKAPPNWRAAKQEIDSQDDSYDPTEDEHREALAAINELAAENERLRESIALGNLDLPEQEKIDLVAELQGLREKLQLAENNSMTLADSRDSYMNRSSEAIERIKKMQHVLRRKDDEIKSLKQELAKERERVESLEAELAFEQATR